MVSKSIAQLEAELAAAKKVANEASEKELIESFNAFKGKCFIVKDTLSIKGKDTPISCGVVRYGKPNFDFFSRELVVVPQQKAVGLIGIGVTRSSIDYISYRAVWEMTESHIKEISKKDFDVYWKLPEVYASSVITNLAVLAGEEKVVDAEKEVDVSIDIPHIVLTAGEASIIEESNFFLKDRVLLISPNSRMEALNLAVRQRQRLDCGSHLYQDCDMAYIKRRIADINSLMDKLNTSYARG